MCKETNNEKLWNILFYLGCIDSFQWNEQQKKEVEDNINYLKKHNNSLKNMSYGTREEVTNFVLQVIDLLYKEYEGNRIEYSSISMIIYSYRYPISIDDFRHWSIFYNHIYQHLEEYKFSKDKQKFISKIKDHILLTMQYKNELDHLREENKKLIDEYSEYNEKIKQQQDNLYKENENLINDLTNEYKNNFKELESTTYELKDKYSKLTIDFITILGIFTGCVFAVFGGFEGIKSILSIDNISHMLIVSGIVLSVVIVVLFAFIQFIGVLTEKRLYSCSCNNNEQHTCSYYERYKILDISLNISFCLLSIGLIISDSNKQIITGIGILLILCISIVFRCVNKIKI